MLVVQMATTPQLVELVKKARDGLVKRNFPQSFELILTLRGIDTKKQELSINENVFLPNKFSRQPKVCIFASGDLAVRARRSGAERVVEPEELDRMATQKREARKITKGFNIFIAEASQMPKIGRVLGPFLGPKGKMPTPVPANAPIEGIVSRFSAAVKVRSKSQLAVTCKVGDEGMSDQQVAENCMAVVGVVEKKLPAGSDNIKVVALKATMGPLVKLSVTEAK